MSGPHLRNNDEVIKIQGVVIMMTSVYVESALYNQREREMVLRNERRRIMLEREGVRPGARAGGRRAPALRNRLHALLTGAPVRG